VADVSRSQLRRTIAQSEVLVVDENTVEIAGVRYRRADLPPGGYEAMVYDGWTRLDPGIRIYVPTEEGGET
jgi:hypothetical protein